MGPAGLCRWASRRKRRRTATATTTTTTTTTVRPRGWTRQLLAAAIVASSLGHASAAEVRATGTGAGAASEFPRYLLPLPSQRRLDLGGQASGWGRSLLLTFDDGPNLVGTSLILDELTRRGVKAVFFVNGRHIVRDRPEDLARRDLLRKLATHGHLVGNHTMSHKNLCQEPDSMAAEIDGTAEIIANATSVRPLLFRSPYGARCRSLDRALADRDVIQVGWNMDPQEWRGEDEDAIVKYATAGLRRAKGPVILLLHDKNVAAVHALTRILDFVDGENARAAREGGVPIRLVDYRVLLPAAPLPDAGVEPVVDWLVSSLKPLSRLATLTAP
jgi:peptidoglycan/xylan/chitin deacetylase (PgdA/CDA1 family)